MAIELTKELRELLRNGIMDNTFIIMTRNHEQDQLIAGGKLSIIMEILSSVGRNNFKSILDNQAVIKALDFVSEMRHFNCENLKERNKNLVGKDDLARAMLFYHGMGKCSDMEKSKK